MAVMVGSVRVLIILMTFALGNVNSTIVLITGSNISVPFPDIEASFAPRVPTLGIFGVVSAEDPSNACKPLQMRRTSELSAFLLVERGECDFVMKVRNAQDAGYIAAIISNNEDSQEMVTMSGSAAGINIFAVSVSKQVGKVLQLCAGDMNCTCYLFPPFETTARSAIALSFILLLSFFAASSIFFFVRRHRHYLTASGPLRRKPGGMSSKEIQALPIILFDSDVNTTVETCTICLEEYKSGEKLRVLPCGHNFHVVCIDQWLTTSWTFCPVCKQDACCKRTNEPPLEQMPLMGSFAAHCCIMASLVLAPDQSSHVRSPLQNPEHFVNLSSSLQAAEHYPSCPITGFCGENDEGCLSSSHVSGTVASSSTLSLPHSNCSACACHTPSKNADNSKSVVEEDVAIHISAVE